MRRALLLLPFLVPAALPAQYPVKPHKAPSKDHRIEVPRRFEVGKPVDPNLALKDLDGRLHRLGDLAGKTVVLHFWSTRCPWVKISDPKMVALAETYAKNPKVVFLAVDSNRTELSPGPRSGRKTPGKTGAARPYAELRETARKRKLPFPVLVDPGNVVADRFQALTTPHCYVIDPKGVLRYSGAFDDDMRGRKPLEEIRRYLKDAIDAVLAGRKVPVTKTRPYGCTIKRVRKPAPKKKGRVRRARG